MQFRRFDIAARWVTILLLIVSGAALAQPRPDGGQILRDIERSTPGQTGPGLAPRVIAPAETPLPSTSDKTILVRGFLVRSERFNQEVFDELLKDLAGRQLTLAQIESAARRVSQFFRDHDLIATAYVPRQTVRDGIVRIVVVEAKVGKVRTDANTAVRLDPDIASRMVARRVPPGEPLRPSQLSEAVTILSEVPGVKAESLLEPGAEEGETDIVLKLEPRPVVSGAVIADNAGSESTGRNRVLAIATLASPFGTGEAVSATALKTRGTMYGRIGVNMLAGTSAWTVGPYFSVLRYEVAGRFKNLGLSGSAVTGGLGAAYPLLRSDTASLSFNTSVEHKRFLDYAFDQSSNRKTIDALSAGLTAMLQDEFLGGGRNTLGATFTIGRLQIGDEAASVSDRNAAGSQGGYTKLVLNASREQILTETFSLFAGTQLQLTRDNLDSSEKISAGGQDDLRGYPSGEASGDLGLKTSLELRWQVHEKVRLTGFWDNAMFRQHASPWRNWEPVTGQANRVSLNSVGVSSSWAPLDNVTLRGIVAWAVGNNPVRDSSNNNSDGKRDRAQAWLQLTVGF